MSKEIKMIKLNEISPYENNPRLNESAIDKVADSIKEFGFQNPIILDKDKVIVAGHTRFFASKQLGLEEVPCIIADELTPQQVKAYRIADNKLGEIAYWNFDALKVELTDLQNVGVDLTKLGFMQGELDNILESLTSFTSNQDENSQDDDINLEEFEGVALSCAKTVCIACKSVEEEEWLMAKLGITGQLKCSYTVAKLKELEA